MKQSPLIEPLEAAEAMDVGAYVLHNPAEGHATDSIITDRSAGFHSHPGFLCFQSHPDVDGNIRLKQVLSVKAAARDAVHHITAQIPVGSSGVRIRTACPITQRVDVCVRVCGTKLFRRRVALTDKQTSSVQDVFSAAAEFAIDYFRNPRVFYLPLGHGHKVRLAAVAVFIIGADVIVPDRLRAGCRISHLSPVQVQAVALPSDAVRIENIEHELFLQARTGKPEPHQTAFFFFNRPHRSADHRSPHDQTQAPS